MMTGWRWAIVRVTITAVAFTLLSAPSIFDAGMSSTRYRALFVVIWVFCLYLFASAIGHALLCKGWVSRETLRSLNLLDNVRLWTYNRLHYIQGHWPPSYKDIDDSDDESIDPRDLDRMRKL